MIRWIRLAVASFLTVLPLVSCRSSVPKGATEAVTLMTKYNVDGKYDGAIKVAQDWLKENPDDFSHAAVIYQQIALTYLAKAAKDNTHKDEWIQQGVAYLDKDLSVHQKTNGDIELYIVGRGFESAGHFSTADRCVYYGRALRAFEDEVPYIQGDTLTLEGKTINLARIRQENEKALERTKAEFAEANCK